MRGHGCRAMAQNGARRLKTESRSQFYSPKMPERVWREGLNVGAATSAADRSKQGLGRVSIGRRSFLSFEGRTLASAPAPRGETAIMVFDARRAARDVAAARTSRP